MKKQKKLGFLALIGLAAVASLFTVCKVHGSGGDYKGGDGEQVKLWKVTFDAGGGEPAPEAVTVADGETVGKLPDGPEKPPAAFDGWYLGDIQFAASTPVSGDITLRAKWHESPPGSVCVTFNGDGGEPGITNIDVSEGGTVSPLPGVTRTGYTFDGWWTEEDGGGEKFTTSTLVTEALPLHAKWLPVTYTISYNANGGTGDMASRTHTYDVPKHLEANDYTSSTAFEGWATSASGEVLYHDEESVTNLAYTQGAVVPLYAVWAIQQYTITFKNGNGAVIQSGYWDHNATPLYTGTTPAKTATVEYIYTWDSANPWNPAIAAATEVAVYTARFTQAANIPPAGMVFVPGGTFTMGSPDGEAERLSREGPQHQVTVSSFYMGVHEVTQKEYLDTMGSWPGTAPSNTYGLGNDFPAYYMSWYDAVNYCNALSLSESLTPAYTVVGTTVTWNPGTNGYRLPTEAEWEYACRAVTETPFSTGDNITTAQANYNGTTSYNGNPTGANRAKATEVGSFDPNGYGLYDMHGNVREWCWDRNGDYASGPLTDPVGAVSGTSRMDRGGCWFDNARNLRSAFRDIMSPSFRDFCMGFRVARPLTN